MLNGLEISEVLLSELENFGDLSSEYYLSEYINKSKTIRTKEFVVLDDIAFITDGEHGSPDWDNNSRIKYITAEHIRPNYILDDNFKTISHKQDCKNARARLQENDVLIYSVGAYAGYTAKAEKHLFPANIPRSVALVRPNKTINSAYLSVFLNSTYGEFQTKRFRAGNSQPVLALEKIKQFEIVLLSDIFQIKINTLYNRAYELRTQSKALYKKAENLLLEELHLKDFKPKDENINIKSLSQSFALSGRLDAEFYQPKYEEIVNIIKKQNFDTLINVVDIAKSIEPGSNNYDEIGLPFVRVADYTKFGISTPQKCLSEDFVNENKEKITALKPKKGTILFSKDGSVGMAFCLQDDFDGITSGAILHLKIKENRNDVLPEYLTLVLNSDLVQMQAQRDVGGSIILHWRVNEIENVVIPIISIEKQQKIADLITQSFTLKAQSEALLQKAKNAVEIAIEKGEEHVNL